MTKQIRINGQDKTVRADTVADLLCERGLPETGRGIAVAINRVLVHREDWATTSLAAGDRVEIIRPIVGG